MNIASFLQIHFNMRHPKQIVLSFAAFDRNSLAQQTSQFSESEGMPHISHYKLSVPLAELEDVKMAINGCFARPMSYSRGYEGDRLARSLQSLSHAGCLDSKEVEILIREFTGSTIQYSGAELVDLELISGHFSIVAFKFLLSIEDENSYLNISNFRFKRNTHFLGCFKRKRVKAGRGIPNRHCQ